MRRARQPGRVATGLTHRARTRHATRALFSRCRVHYVWYRRVLLWHLRGGGQGVHAAARTRNGTRGVMLTWRPAIEAARGQLGTEAVALVDAEDPKRSSWCRYINHASREAHSANATPHVDADSRTIWFIAVRDIAAGEEICVRSALPRPTALPGRCGAHHPGCAARVSRRYVQFDYGSYYHWDTPPV
jgi:hypothetical protein